MRLIVTGGGTGGHLFPGIALATGMQERVKDCRILFIGTRRQLDKDTLARYDFELASIECMGLKGMGVKNRIRSVMQMPAAILKARKIIRQFKPDLVFGVGGYVTGPVLLAARMQGCPVCIHEQNSVPGLTNKFLARIADRIFISIPCAYPFAVDKTLMTGNPVRREIINAAAEERKTEDGKLTVLVLGGSQGAHRVNMLVAEAAAAIRVPEGMELKWIHQTGKNDLNEVKSRYQERGSDALVGDFFQDMASIYRQADLVISRAGATTLAELSVMGLPALLIPYPHAADNHQQENALYYAAGGAVKILPEKELSPEKLVGEITALAANPDKLQAMAANMKKMGRPDATERIIEACLALASVRQIPDKKQNV
ncbi:MAG: undecaprenyldiphospho-muramoylpentapeptide beta-N-acetylglucosaminyltransferase [Desulfobulbaceae bacterium]|nr:undecaprenyldiphospho-muramoylpentapeptide beta-N-acetylglucosaminyltransferase [Desulfobulbaceae bacterium]